TRTGRGVSIRKYRFSLNSSDQAFGEHKSMAQVAAISSGSIRVFGYVTAEKAALYRAIMRVFTEANALFTFHLRPRQILERVVAAGFPASVDEGEIDSALSQLSEWG